MFLGVVLNPRARKNRASARLKDHDRAARLARLVGPWGEVFETRSVADIGSVVERLLPRATHLVSDGGDGALHWLVNEVWLRESSSARWPTFVPTNGGTIDFVARKVGTRGRSEDILRALVAAASAGRAPHEEVLDTLRLTGSTADGVAFDRVGFALAAGGVGNRFFDKYYEDPDPSPATIVRVIGRTIGDWTIELVAPRLLNGRSYARHLFRPTRARVCIDGEELPTLEHSGLHAAAFDVNLGGVLRVFPLAKTSGVLHFQAGEMSPGRIIAHLPELVIGGSIRGSGLRDIAGGEMTIETVDSERLSPIIDGERFDGLTRLVVRAGPRIRVARVRAR